MEEIEIFPEGETKETKIIPSNIQNSNKSTQIEIIKNLISKFDSCNKELKEQKIKIEEQNKRIIELEMKVKYLEDENLKMKNELKSISTKNLIEKLNEENKEEEIIQEKKENKKEEIIQEEKENKKEEKKEEINQIINPKSQIINIELFNQLNNWIDPNKPLKFELIFTASKDGDSSEIFHKICDGKGPTVTLIKSKNGHIFGGYLTVPFSSDRKSHSDDKAFLFSLTNLKKFKIKEVAHALYHYAKGWGPYIGYKDSCDLAIKSECLSNKKSKCEPTSYEFNREDLIGTKEKYFEVEDYEIYLVK